jgi:hypothetical protein
MVIVSLGQLAGERIIRFHRASFIPGYIFHDRFSLNNLTCPNFTPAFFGEALMIGTLC